MNRGRQNMHARLGTATLYFHTSPTWRLPIDFASLIFKCQVTIDRQSGNYGDSLCLSIEYQRGQPTLCCLQCVFLNCWLLMYTN